MKKLTKFSLLLLLFTLVVTLASAQQPLIPVKGHVTNKQTGAAIGGHTMYVMLDSLNSSYMDKTITDENGYYSFILPYNAFAMQGAFTVYTNDCDGSVIYGTGALMPGKEVIIIDFNICGNTPTDCVAAFRYLMASNSGMTINYLDGSYGTPDSANINYFWDFGDNTSSTQQNPVHTYAQSGKYNVCLMISSSDSLCHSKFCMPVEVGSPVPDPCQNTFWYYKDSLGAAYVFEGSLKNSQALSWKWDFGDGTYAEGQKVTHVFSNTSTPPKVCLTTTGVNADGTTCTSTSCQDVFIYVPSPCESSFSYQPDSSGTSYIFQGWTKNSLVNSWKWNFGDGTFASGQTVTHSFSSMDNRHKVCLTTSGAGSDNTTCNYSSCQDVFVYIPSPCESAFLYQADSTGNGYTFTGYAKNSQVTSWKWDFGDGTTATGQQVSHIFSGSGTSYTVCLTTSALDASGTACTSKSCQDIYLITPSPCQNYFKFFTTDNFTYTFSGGVNSGQPSSYYWDFGDGTTGTGQVVTHAYGKIYTNFEVCLTTVAGDPTTNDYCKSISCQTIYNGVDTTMCQAVISAKPIDATGNTFQFANVSQSTYRYVYWDFGDGSQSTEANPVHTYSSPGIYFACLTIGNSTTNCKNQSCQEIWVNMIQPECKATFYAFPADSVPSTLSFMFVNNSAPGYTNQEWSFGDGTVSNDPIPVHTYSTPGIYIACLTIWDSTSRCKNTWCMNLFAGKVNGNNTLTGIVLAGNTPADKGVVWLISPDNTYNAETKIDSVGTYTFTEVPTGSYYIYTMLTPGSSHFFDYMPTYYKSSITWQGATVITSGEPNAWYPVNLVPSINNSQGNASINGNVNWTDAAGSPISPVSNVALVLYNSAGEPVAYTFSENDGTYQFNNLPYGNYTLRAEMAGKNTQTVEINLSQDSAVTNINFVVDREAINATGIDSRKSKTEAGNVYPNPVSETLNLDLNDAASEKAEVEIIDMQVRTLHYETIGLPGGKNQISLSTGFLTKGVYLLRIKSGGNAPVLRKFIK
jgi:PKD repeat protein